MTTCRRRRGRRALHGAGGALGNGRQGPHHPRLHVIGLALGRVVGVGEPLVGEAIFVVLHDVRQLMSNEAIPLGGAGLELTRPEVEIRSNGEGMRLEILGCRRGAGPRMHPNMAEVMVECGFHLRLHPGGQRLTGLRRHLEAGRTRQLGALGLGGGRLEASIGQHLEGRTLVPQQLGRLAIGGQRRPQRA
jgi:hypothetical protein